jgi:hypothetical protein
VAESDAMKLFVDSGVPAATIALLKEDGLRRRESVVLWLGRRHASEVRIVEALRPDQRSGLDFFQIPAVSMVAIQERLRSENLMIGAQVHTHPMEAFHSRVDDQWAIVRHIGALSLVIPYFAQQILPESFWNDMAAFVMSADGRWVAADARHHVEVVS